MKLVTRALAFIGAVVAGMFVASPALAHDPHTGTSQYSTAGSSPDVVAITVVMVVLLIVILLISTWVGNLFEKKES